MEKIYQSFESVFHRLSKHLEFRHKYSAARRIFNSLHGVWISRWNTVFCDWYSTWSSFTVCAVRSPCNMFKNNQHDLSFTDRKHSWCCKELQEISGHFSTYEKRWDFVSLHVTIGEMMYMYVAEISVEFFVLQVWPSSHRRGP